MHASMYVQRISTLLYGQHMYNVHTARTLRTYNDPCWQVLPLRLGHLAVANRSQADLAAHRSMADSRAAEASFFASHPVYAQVRRR